MSTTSLYEPDEDEEASDSDVEYTAPKSGFPASSPPLQGLRISSPSETDEENHLSRPHSGASRGARYRANRLRPRTLTKEIILAYRRMLDEIDDDVSTGPTFDSGESHHPSQNGAVTWSSGEKETFFNVLARKGKNAVQEIADAIGSKSKLEVLDYLKLLQNGLERQHLLERHTRTIVLGDVPAASEISEECCEALEELAEAISLQQQASEDHIGTRQHNDFWIVTREKAKQIEEQMEAQDVGSEAEPSIFLTASFLNIRKWIRMSERFFMNYGGSRVGDNWVNVAYADESPSLTSDAFADFYALAVSVTRRLVQASLFFAMSRIRDLTYTNREKARVVRTRDIRAAVDVLNMKYDSSEFWAGVARRCNLNVADIRNRKGWVPGYMSYDEIENALSGPIVSRERSVSPPPCENQPEDLGEEEDEENEDSEDLSEAPSSPGSILGSSPPPTSDEESPSDLEETHAEYVDQETSRAEELRIWQSLKRPAPSFLDPQIKTEDRDEDSAAPRKPIGERKTKQELVDWRDRTLYRSEWEEYGYEVYEIEDELESNRRKRRRIEREEPGVPSEAPAGYGGLGPESDDDNMEQQEEGVGEDDVTDPYYDEDEGEEFDSYDGGMELDPDSEAHSDPREDQEADIHHGNQPQKEEYDHPHQAYPSSHSSDGRVAVREEEDLSSPATGDEDNAPLHSQPLTPVAYEPDDSE